MGGLGISFVDVAAAPLACLPHGCKQPHVSQSRGAAASENKPTKHPGTHACMRTSALGRLQSGRTFVYTPFPVSPKGQSPPPTLFIGRTLLIRGEHTALPPLNPPSSPMVEPLSLPPPVPFGEASRLGCLCILDCHADG